MAPRGNEMGHLMHGFRKYPSMRDVDLKSAATWIRGKKMDDDCDGLWRVHDKLYDLSDFASRHPGGSEWIRMTQGTDITEVFESSHLDPKVAIILEKFYVRLAAGERNSPYTFHADGFYATLKRKVFSRLRDIPPERQSEGRRRVANVQNGILALLATLFLLTIYTESTLVALLTGSVLFLNTNCAHNFYHQRDTWRMYCWDLSLLSSYEWRITHALSHHIYTNSINDYEISGFEPHFDFKAHKNKSMVRRFAMAFLGQFIFPLFFFSDLFKRCVNIVGGHQRLRAENLLPLAELLILMATASQWIVGLKLWCIVQMSASYWFGFIGVIVAHHHPDLFHAGDDFDLGTDWGLCQLDAVRDRRDVHGHLVAELTTYGNHVLHHLFPTVDHGLLPFLQADFVDTCAQFGIKDVGKFHERYSQWDMLVGTFQQLARTEPRPRQLAKTD